MIQGRVLAIDYGEVRVGIALSDPLRILATPFVVLKNDGNLLENIKKIITEKQVSQIVLGLPINLKGKDSKKTEEIRKFYRTVSFLPPILSSS
jgi:putative Holliday junction resolvase